MTNTYFQVELYTLSLVPRAKKTVLHIVQAPSSQIALERAQALFFRDHHRWQILGSTTLQVSP